MPDGARYSVFYIHPNRGKKLVTGRATKEKLGYIGYGSYIENVHEADIAGSPEYFVCGVCQKQFTISGDRAWCNTCYPPQSRPQPTLGDLQPRSAQQRVQATNRFAQEQWSQPHPNFQQQPQVPPPPQQAPQRAPQQAPPMPEFNPNVGFSQQAPQQAQQVPEFNPTPPPQVPQVPVIDDPKSVVGQARQQKSQAFGIPVVEPDVIGPPPNLSAIQPQVPEPVQPQAPPQLPPPPAIPQPLPSVNNAKISEVDFGRSVNKNHKKILADNGIVTLYDASKAGRVGLESISGIGAAVATAVLKEAGSNM